MKRSMFSRALALALVLLVLASSVKSVTGQEPRPDQRNTPPAVTGIEAAVASRISYQGVLKESGTPVTGSRNMVFRLHTNNTCTSQVGSNITKNGVSVVNGLFTVILDVPQSSFNGQALWLQVLVGGVSLGCHQITATPYALSLRPGALISDTLSGPVLKLSNTAVAPGIQSLTGEGKAGDLHPPFYNAAGEFAGANGVIGAASTDSGDGYGVVGLAQGSSGVGVYGRASAASGTTHGGSFEAYSTAGKGVNGRAIAVSGTTYGGYFYANSTSGRGVYGEANASSGVTYGVYGMTNSPSGYGVLGTAPTYGVRGNSTSTGSSSYGVYGDSNSLNTSAAGGRFVAGTSATTSQSDGVIGLAYGNNTQAVGLAGWAYYQGVGVGAWSYSGNIMEGYQGDYPGGTRRMYLTGAGNLYIDGSYSIFAKTQDGSRQVLYSAQSTELWVEDFGTAQLAEGLATVRIAADFAKTVNLNADYHVFLTPLGDCALYVAEKTATSFTVGAIDDKACNIAFDYRIVAKQVGMESYRMTEIASQPVSPKTEPLPEEPPFALPEPEPHQPSVNGQAAP
ncbi:MAG: hypothetical protein JW892_10230 [Anaerolineae bacterium]|nr:hypothetical protein [Anaerolineae bacterium]